MGVCRLQSQPHSLSLSRSTRGNQTKFDTIASACGLGIRLDNFIAMTRLARTSDSSAARFLDAWDAPVPLDTPSESQIEAHERPSLRRTAILKRSTITRGLPRRFPRDFANANPDLTRSRISSLSNSAIEAKIPKTSRPLGLRQRSSVRAGQGFSCRTRRKLRNSVLLPRKA